MAIRMKQNVTNVNGKIAFADLTYDKAGTYEYEVARYRTTCRTDTLQTRQFIQQL